MVPGDCGPSNRMPGPTTICHWHSWWNRSKKYWKSKKKSRNPRLSKTCLIGNLKILCHYVAQVKSPSFRPEACYARVSGHPEIAASPGDKEMLPKISTFTRINEKNLDLGDKKNSQKNRQETKESHILTLLFGT